jgi:CBS domain-containing protein
VLDEQGQWRHRRRADRALEREGKEVEVKIVEATRRSAIGIETDRTVAQAAELMEQSGVGALVVLDHDAVVGIVTDRDLVRRVLARRLPGDTRIDSAMTTQVITADADADVAEAFSLFDRHAVRRLPIVSQGRFVGMFTIDDALVAIARDLGRLVRPITAEMLFAHRDPHPPAVATS